MPKKLSEYINSELLDAEIYKALAKTAQNEEAFKKLTEIAEDEISHAEMFAQIYKIMTGYMFQPDVAKLPALGSFKSAIKSRILDEIADSKKYHADAIENHDKFRLRNAFLKASHDEAMHALILSQLQN